MDARDLIHSVGLSCSAALHRLNVGIPATIEHGGSGEKTDAGRSAMHIMQVTQHYITAMDSVKLNMCAADALFPILTDLMRELNAVGGVLDVDGEFQGKALVRQWLVQLNGMKASEELDEVQARQLLFDLENSYNAFHRLLAN